MIKLIYTISFLNWERVHGIWRGCNGVTWILRETEGGWWLCTSDVDDLLVRALEHRLVHCWCIIITFSNHNINIATGSIDYRYNELIIKLQSMPGNAWNMIGRTCLLYMLLNMDDLLVQNLLIITFCCANELFSWVITFIQSIHYACSHPRHSLIETIGVFIPLYILVLTD